MRAPRYEREEFILSRLPAYGCILHVGCTRSPETVHQWESNNLLHKRICDKFPDSKDRVVGIDIDAGAIAYLQDKMVGQQILQVDAHDLSTAFSQKFRSIIAGDVIEHLENPGVFLSSCKAVLEERGEVILTTANAYSLVRFLKSALNHEAVHDEHTAYFSHKTLNRLLGLVGLKMVFGAYYRCESMNRFSVNVLISNTLEHIASSIWPHWSEGLIAVAHADPESP